MNESDARDCILVCMFNQLLTIVLYLDDIDRLRHKCFAMMRELISNPEHIKYFSFKCWHFNGFRTLKEVVPVLCLI